MINEQLNDTVEAYLVSLLKTKLSISVLGKEIPLEVKDIADGCVGVSLWFDTFEHAIKWGGEDCAIKKGMFEMQL